MKTIGTICILLLLIVRIIQTVLDVLKIAFVLKSFDCRQRRQKEFKDGP